jgi:hypothetical protein
MKPLISALLAAAIILAACDATVNKSIYIKDNAVKDGSINSVNGSIFIGENAKVTGDCRSVNGSISIRNKADVSDLAAINGNIETGSDVLVREDIQSINGSINTGPGTKIRGDCETINGNIVMNNTQVGRKISTYNGNITLDNKSDVAGDIIIKKNKGRHNGHNEKMQIVISIMNDSKVHGSIIVEDDKTDVTVRLISGGQVEGKVENAQVVKEE